MKRLIAPALLLALSAGVSAQGNKDNVVKSPEDPPQKTPGIANPGPIPPRTPQPIPPGVQTKTRENGTQSRTRKADKKQESKTAVKPDKNAPDPVLNQAGQPNAGKTPPRVPPSTGTGSAASEGGRERSAGEKKPAAEKSEKK